MKKFLMFLFALVFAIDSFATGISGASAPCDNATLSKYTGTADIEINWEPNTIGLKWFNGDQQIAGPTSCVYDSTLSVPPQPTKPGYTFNGWKVWKITVPDGYTQLEYIQSTGTQWINTNYFPNNNTGVKTKIQFDSVENYEALCFGGASGDNRGFEGFVWNGGMSFIYGDYIHVKHVSLNDFLEIDWDKNVLNYKINNGNITNYVFPVQTFVEQNPMRIFALSRSSHVFGNTKIKIYYFKIYDDNVLIYNFIPARRNSDGVVGMFDSVSGQFFTNSGNGNFVAGPVAN